MNLVSVVVSGDLIVSSSPLALVWMVRSGLCVWPMLQSPAPSIYYRPLVPDRPSPAGIRDAGTTARSLPGCSPVSCICRTDTTHLLQRRSTTGQCRSRDRIVHRLVQWFGRSWASLEPTRAAGSCFLRCRLETGVADAHEALFTTGIA
jgi:hypothetical protein